MNQLSTLQKVALYAGIISGFTNSVGLAIQVNQILNQAQPQSQSAPIVQAERAK